MSITLQHVNPSATRVYMGTLTGGANVHDALAAVARAQHIQAAAFDLLGGLTEVEFSAYDFTTQTRLPPLTLRGALEIAAGHGTISLLDDQPHVHLHLVVARRDDAAPQGVALCAGHAARALAFAVELTLTVYDGAPVRRAPHPSTGLNLWKLPPFASR